MSPPGPAGADPGDLEERQRSLPGSEQGLVAGAPTTTTPAVAAVPATASPAAATPGAFFARASFVDRQCPAFQILARGALDGGLGPLGCCHGHKSEPPRASGGAVRDEVNVCHGSESGEKILEIVFCDVERKVPDE
jgi:hypothetical protein